MKSKSLRETAVVKILRYTLGLFFAFASSGYAADVLYHGSFCNPNTSVGGQAFYNQWGVANISPVSSLTVNCGGVLAFSGISNIAEVDVFVYDCNASEDVVCTLTTVALDGVAVTTQTQRSFGSSDPGQFLIFNPIGSTILTTFGLECTIPPFSPAGPGGGHSHVTTYRVITTP